MEPNTICLPLAIQLIGNKILKLYISCEIAGKKKLVLMDYAGKIYHLENQDTHAIDSDIAKRNFIPLKKTIVKKYQFILKDLNKTLTAIEKLIK